MFHFIGAEISFTQAFYTVSEDDMILMVGVVLQLEVNASLERDIRINIEVEEKSVDIFLAVQSVGM